MLEMQEETPTLNEDNIFKQRELVAFLEYIIIMN